MKDIKMMTDADAVKLAVVHDNFFEILAIRYEMKLYWYIFRLSGLDKEVIEDLLQEVFIKVYENLNDFDDEFPFSSWIYRIAHNVTVSHLRNTKNHIKIVSIDDEEFSRNFIELLPADINLPKELDSKNLSQKVREALMNLPDIYREVLVLYYLEEKSYKEISDILKRSINSVSVLINRAKAKLKPELESLNR
jgi:RNA polymerase sigma-70 factor (ECF subfamily)